ncbi:MAG: hypothetical protein ACLU3G_08065 [Christensenellales bacterium]
MSAKHIPAIALALVIILTAAFSVTACGGYDSSVSIPATSVPATQPVSAKPGPQMTTDPVGPSFTPKPTDTPTPTPTGDAWKAEFEADLRKNYGVEVDHYEFIGGTSYQAYVRINGEIVPYVCIDSATGNYHG